MHYLLLNGGSSSNKSLKKCLSGRQRATTCAVTPTDCHYVLLVPDDWLEKVIPPISCEYKQDKSDNMRTYMGDKLTHQYKDITIEHANNLWSTAIKTGYEVAF